MIAARARIEAILPSVASVLGVPGTADQLGLARTDLADSRAIVVLLVDGLGHRSLEDHAELAPALMAGSDQGPLETSFPSTTATALTSLGTGLRPGQHGIMGSAFEVEYGTPLSPLSWKTHPNPIATQPEPTIFERAARASLSVVTVAPEAFEGSGLTRAALRGGSYAGVKTIADRVVAVRAALGALGPSERALIYVYWPDLDKAGHVHGVDSAVWRRELAVVDDLCAQLRAELGPRDGLLVTADHGMVDVADPRRIDLDRSATLYRDVRRILGEPRMRHVYTKAGAACEVALRWAHELSDVAVVATREQAVASGWFGEVDDWNLQRIGDVVAVAQEDYSLVSERTDRIVSNLRGQHGGTTPIEVEIPIRLFTGS